MRFFVPYAESDELSDEVYIACAKFVSAPIQEKRIWKLRWRHNEMDMSCEVGKPLPSYYRTGEEPVMAIYDCGLTYKICTHNRGGLRGDPVLAGKNDHSWPQYFDELED